MFSNTFAGIAPASVPGFVIAQAIGGCLAVLAIRTLYPLITPADASAVVVSHSEDAGAQAAAGIDGGRR